LPGRFLAGCHFSYWVAASLNALEQLIERVAVRTNYRGFAAAKNHGCKFRSHLEKEYDMQIILQEDVENLGHRGDVVTVKPGYARNFLLPRKIGIEATTGNMQALERIRTSLAKKTATELDAAHKQAELLNGVAVKFARKTGENDQMFGSVTSGDISEALAAQGFKVDKRQIQLAEPIKVIGEQNVTVKVFRDVTAAIKVTVDKEI
jgi:large subunit ribosomal protein L9